MTTRTNCPLLSRYETFQRMDEAQAAIAEAERLLGEIIEWGELEPTERDNLTRAANAAGLAGTRARGVGPGALDAGRCGPL